MTAEEFLKKHGVHPEEAWANDTRIFVDPGQYWIWASRDPSLFVRHSKKEESFLAEIDGFQVYLAAVDPNPSLGQPDAATSYMRSKGK